MTKKQIVEKEVYGKLNGAFADTSVVSALDAACKILDYKFGEGFHIENPSLAIQMTETLMKNIRMNDYSLALKNGIGEYLDALRVVILEKDTELKGSISVDLSGAVETQ